jgi:WD40 repeat protein/serine/threonine protein kinase
MDDASMDHEPELEDLLSLWQRRCEEGVALTPAELCRQRPDLLPELERRIAALERMDALAGAVHGTATLDTAGSLRGTATALPFVEGKPSAATSLPVVMDLRGYELIEPLGKGGMGEVYRSCDPALHRDLAIKVMAASLRGHAEGERRFLREARITGSLQHPGIVAVYNLGRLADGRLHYTMRLVRGRTFADILKQEAGKPEHLPALLAIFEKVCDAVAYAHSKHVIHRDLKPGNIMVRKFGEVQVMDWGLAKLLNAEGGPADADTPIEAAGTLIHTEAADTPSDLTRAGTGIGTPEYMSPEQAQGDWQLVDERADVFALGAMLCLILTGRSPYSGADGIEVLRRARRGDLTEALARLQQCGADAALTELCRACLAVERQQRPKDAGEVARRVAEHRVVVEQRLRQAELQRTAAEVTTREERKRRRQALGLSAAVVLVLAAGIVTSALFAVDARHQAGEAKKNEQDAIHAKRKADENAERIEWLLYASQIARAQREWQDGDVQHARDLLDACRRDFRGWEHAYLRHLFDEIQQPFRGHTLPVLSVCFSPDGKRLASSSWDKTVKVWEASTGQELLTLKGHIGAVSSVCFSPDCKRLASGNDDTTVKVWEASTGQELLTLKGHQLPVSSVCFSPDGKRLASASGDKKVKVWDAQTGQEILTFNGHSGTVRCVAFSPDGQRLASASSDDTVKMWDARTGQEILTLKGHTSDVSSVGFSPDGKRLASSGWDKTVQVWGASTGQGLLTLKGHTRSISSVCFSPDGERLASGSSDNTVKVWEASTGQELLTLKGHTGAVSSVCFSPDGKRLASGSFDNTVKVWEASSQ